MQPYTQWFLKFASVSLVWNFASFLLIGFVFNTQGYAWLWGTLTREATVYVTLWQHAMLTLGLLLMCVVYDTLRKRYLTAILSYAYVSHSFATLWAGYSVANGFVIYLGMLSTAGCVLYAIAIVLDYYSDERSKESSKK
jgi:hypothetical protein